MKQESAGDKLLHELRDLHSAERQLTKALPKMAQGAANPELAAGFEKHTEETKGHVKRLEAVCRDLGVTSKGDKNQEMAKLIEDGEKLCEDPASTDAELISAAQRVERYEMDGYGQAIASAKDLGLEGAAQELKR